MTPLRSGTTNSIVCFGRRRRGRRTTPTTTPLFRKRVNHPCPVRSREEVEEKGHEIQDDQRKTEEEHGRYMRRLCSPSDGRLVPPFSEFLSRVCPVPLSRPNRRLLRNRGVTTGRSKHGRGHSWEWSTSTDGTSVFTAFCRVWSPTCRV